MPMGNFGQLEESSFVEVCVIGLYEIFALVEVLLFEVADASHPRSNFFKGFIVCLNHHYKPSPDITIEKSEELLWIFVWFNG